MLRGILLAGTSLALLTGCVTTQRHEREVEVKPEVMTSYLSDKPEQTHRLYARVLKEGDRNAVLNHMRAGLAAFELGEDEFAAASFDEALHRIEAIYANNPTAESARSTFTKENIKDFKGEAYERAMAYYYRGLLYLRAGDFDNARASFQGGLLQDTFAEDQRYSADFASLAFLSGWAAKCKGSSLAAEDFGEAAKIKSDLTAPPANHRLLLIAETGSSPRKVAEGEYKHLLKYQRGEGPEQAVNFTVGTKKLAARRAEDLYWQAVTRGGREVDTINAGKAEFKDGAETAGNVAVGAGLGMMTAGAYSGNRDMQTAGAIVGLIGLMAHAAAAATMPQADIRYWDNLPGDLFLTTNELPAKPMVSVEFLPGGAPTPVKVVSAQNCSIAWTRSKSALSIPDSAPGAVASINE